MGLCWPCWSLLPAQNQSHGHKAAVRLKETWVTTGVTLGGQLRHRGVHSLSTTADTRAALMQPYILVLAASCDMQHPAAIRAHHISTAVAPETPWMLSKHPPLTEEQSPRTEPWQQLLTPLQHLHCSSHTVPAAHRAWHRQGTLPMSRPELLAGSWEGPAAPQPPPHRFSGGDNEPAQDARQGIGCPEGCPLNPHVLWEEQQSLPTLLPSPGCPMAWGLPPPWAQDHHLPHPRTGDPLSLLWTLCRAPPALLSLPAEGPASSSQYSLQIHCRDRSGPS